MQGRSAAAIDRRFAGPVVVGAADCNITALRIADAENQIQAVGALRDVARDRQARIVLNSNTNIRIERTERDVPCPRVITREALQSAALRCGAGKEMIS